MASDRMVASIEALRTQNYNVASGFKSEIYLDPQCGTVYLFQDSQNSQPSEAFHGEVADDIEALLGDYRGSEWDGRNWVGKWADGDGAVRSAVEALEFPVKLDSDEWLNWDGDGEAKAVRLHREGLSPERMIEEGHFTLEGDGGCYVDRDELIASIRRAIEWADDQE